MKEALHLDVVRAKSEAYRTAYLCTCTVRTGTWNVSYCAVQNARKKKKQEGPSISLSSVLILSLKTGANTKAPSKNML